jgi:hypothetical protein
MKRTAIIAAALSAAALGPAVPAGTAQAASVQSVQPVHPVATMSMSTAQQTRVKLPFTAYSGPVRLKGSNNKADEHSTNWGGYVTTQRWFGQYRGVSSDFTVPYVNTLSISASAGNLAAHWVGLDGLTNGTVEQDGVGEYYDTNFGIGHSFTWWELYPANSMQPLYSVYPGDSVSASVMWHEGSYWKDGRPAFEMKVTDNTTGSWYSYGWRPNYYTPTRKNAEVITEVPGSSAGTFALTNYGNETYTNASSFTMGYKKRGMGSDLTQKSHRIYLVNSSKQHLADTSALTNHGSTFSTPYRRGL